MSRWRGEVDRQDSLPISPVRCGRRRAWKSRNTVDALAEPFPLHGQLVRVLDRSSPCLEGRVL